MKPLGLTLAACLLFVPTPAAAQRDMLFLNLVFPQEVAVWVEKEYARVEKLCRSQESDCWTRELQHQTWTLNPVYSSPDERATHNGILVAVTAYTPADGVHFRFDYRPLIGAQKVWLGARDIGDWGYNIYTFVVAKRPASKGSQTTWVQLPADPFPAPAWIKLDERGVNGDVESVVGRIVRIEGDIQGRNRRTGRGATLPTRPHYVVERIEGSSVMMREEVPADMPCIPGTEKDIVTSQTPRYRVPLASLFGQNGKPRLSLAYPRGC
ncbi:MAG: hypothetical protein ACRD1Q_14775 [Vicinamibacterales bacterium]